MDQSKLFYDSVEDAIGTTIMACGGYKKVAGTLWPAMKIESAYARLKNCLHPDKDEKLSPGEVEQIVAWGREKNCHAYMQYMAAKYSYKVETLDPEDEKARLQKQFVEAASWLRNVSERLEQL